MILERDIQNFWGVTGVIQCNILANSKKKMLKANELMATQLKVSNERAKNRIIDNWNWSRQLMKSKYPKISKNKLTEKTILSTR